MVLSIIVILKLTTHTYCDHGQLLYVENSGKRYDGPYVKTGEVEGRPEYEHTSNISKIMFRDNNWVIPDDTDIWFIHPNQSLTPPETDWKGFFLDDDAYTYDDDYAHSDNYAYEDDYAHDDDFEFYDDYPYDDDYDYDKIADLVVHKVPVTLPPLVLSIKDDSIPLISGLYTLSDTQYNGYPLYNSSQGHIAVEGNNGNYYSWYWQDNTKGKKVQLTQAEPPPYTSCICRVLKGYS